MKKLTINRIAGAGLRGNFRAYASLAAGIFLSIFLISALCFSVQGIMAAEEEKVHRRMGYQDCMLLDSEITDDALTDEGGIDEIGHVYLTAAVADMDVYLGYADEAAHALLRREMEEGRMPAQPGEIALERSALEKLRLEAEVGEEISMSLRPVGGKEEERAFTLVGILKEQSQYLLVDEYDRKDGTVTAFPAGLIHPEEEAFSSGRTVVHRLMSLKKNVSLDDMLVQWEKRGENFFGVGIAGEVQKYAYGPLMMDDSAWMMLVMAVILGAALIAATGIGIAQAMEGRISGRVEQIGMLRAVGATRRQIRRIFGREAWLLAGGLAPLSVAAGLGFVYALSRMVPEIICFEGNWKLIVPVVVLSAGCILLSASLPLIRASRIMPMSVIRDVTLIRRSKAIRVKKQFSVPRLIASRQMRLHTGRLIGSAFLVTVTLFCVCLTTWIYSGVMQPDAGDEAAFTLRMNEANRLRRDSFIQTMPRMLLSEQDILQMERMEHVSDVRAIRELRVNLVMEEVDEYILRCEEEEVSFALNNRHLMADEAKERKERHEQVKEKFSIDGNLVDFFLYIVDGDALDCFYENLDSGDIRREEIDAGREVLAWTPDTYITHDGEGSTFFSHDPRFERGEPDVIVTGGFDEGQILNIAQLFRMEGVQEQPNEERPYGQILAEAELREAEVSVGGVLKKNLASSGVFYPADLCLITTLEGAKNMGLYTGTMESAAVFLEGEIDVEEEEILEKKICLVAARGDRVEVSNRLKMWRESREQTIQLMLVFVCIALVFFAVSLSIIAGSVKRRIRSDERMLGMLRAVGADKRSVAGCYSGQTLIVVLAGWLAAGVLYSICFKLSTSGYVVWHGIRLWVALLLETGMAVLLYGLCFAGVRAAVRGILKKSIVENIREL